ncbi:MAG: hypothetical protein K5917_06320, partial [Clostridiales bacterium]|nr:hypothetical protein [Clostridiales bacterium]
MKNKKIAIILLAFIILISMIPLTSSALSGSGTADNPYQLNNYNDLKTFADLVNSGNTSACAILKGNIEAYEHNDWIAIGSAENKYSGTFDGNGHSIIRLSNSDISEKPTYSGLFGYIGSGANIKNLCLNTVTSISKNNGYSGGIAGYSKGNITNCYIQGNLQIVKENGYSGGLVGLNEGIIENCYCSGSGNISAYYAGGIAGANKLKVLNCFSIYSGNISGDYCGGIVGLNYAYVEYCYVSSQGKITAENFCGGIVGDNNAGIVYSCYNSSSTIFEGRYTGGISGNNSNGEIANCYNSSDLDLRFSDTSYTIGSIVATNNSGTIDKCYNTGKISIQNSPSSYIVVAGIAGTTSGGNINNCLNLGDIEYSGNNPGFNYFIGGIVGIANSGTSIEENINIG